MDWLQLHITSSASQLDAVESLCLDAGAVSITLTDAGDSPILEPAPGEQRLWPDTITTALFAAEPDPQRTIAALRRNLAALGDVATSLEALQERVWEREWLRDFKPTRFGQRLWICPTGTRAPDANAVEIDLDPGLAFGTGSHPTTALCLDWLDGAELQNRRIVDFGCGSGVLGIAALKLGAAEVFATDIDPQALTASRDNAARNGVAEKLQTGRDVIPDTEKFDVVLANILAGTLVELAPKLTLLCRLGGQIVLSGILLEQADVVAERYSDNFILEPVRQREDWIALVGTRER